MGKKSKNSEKEGTTDRKRDTERGRERKGTREMDKNVGRVIDLY